MLSFSKIFFLSLATAVATSQPTVDRRAVQGDAAAFLADLETYYVRGYVLDMALSRFNGSEDGMSSVADAMEDLGKARLRLESDADSMVSLSGPDSRAVVKELVSHTALDDSYLSQLGSKKDLFVAVDKAKEVAEVLLSTNRTVTILLPVIREKVDSDDGIAVDVMQQFLLQKIGTALAPYSSI